MPTEIIDVHTRSTNGIPVSDIANDILVGLSKSPGQKQLPTILLYDERGLRLYDDITTRVPEYYLFGAEEEILKGHTDDIIKSMHPTPVDVSTDEIILELGAGYVNLDTLWGPISGSRSPFLF